jgi:6-phosphogluconolactonase
VAEPHDIEIVVADDAAGAAAIVAERLAQSARDGEQIVLTGGSTPKLAYEQAAVLEPDWSGAELWWGDERSVPPDHEWSNYRMAKAALLDNLERAPLPAKVHRMRGELGPEEGAALYEQELGSLERFDLVLLGMGPDGHIASLYPEQPTLDVTDRRVVGAEAKLEPYVDRITLTLPTLRSAREVLFLIAGADKADAVRRAFAGQPSRATPASLVRAVRGKTTAVLDAAAASKL